jgi:hypothetical protein
MSQRQKAFFIVAVVVMCLNLPLTAQQTETGSAKPMDDDDRQFTNVGNLGLTVSNFGTIGTRNRYWPSQPSCEYPRGSRIEHLYQGGLWVGARSRSTGLFHVSTGVTDRSGSSGSGYEYTTEIGAGITQRSTLSDSRYFKENAVSHQDFLADYTDKYTRVPATQDSIVGHEPLGITVHQESYAWNFPFADFFVVLNYTIVNTGTDYLDSVYVGMWVNNVVRNTNFVRPGSAGYFDRGGNGYDTTQRALYTFEFDPSPGGVPADSYVALKFLGSDPFPRGVDSLAQIGAYTYFNAWGYRSASGAYVSPTDDYTGDRWTSRFLRMAQSLPPDIIAPLRTAAYNMTTLISVGSFKTLAPQDTLHFALAVVCAKKVGADPERFDTPYQRSKLTANLIAAQKLYDGEDLNGNNKLDPGEDVNGNNTLDRYLLPSPPRQPKVRAVVDNQDVAIYWDRATAEETVDPISRVKDFEGYRIYRSAAGADFRSQENLTLSLSLVGEFDQVDDVGMNTGFGRILLKTPKKFPGDTTEYWYRFPPEDAGVTHLNGWQYIYGISAFDHGDSSNSLPQLESAQRVVRVMPGTLPTTSADVGVYPNPYYARAYWDGGSERTRKIYFYNLPQQCTITIYTIAGDLVTTLNHDAATANGQEIDWFTRYGDRTQPIQFAGGEHAWSLITQSDQAIATGLYLFVVKDKTSGDIKRGKFLVVK